MAEHNHLIKVGPNTPAVAINGPRTVAAGVDVHIPGVEMGRRDLSYGNIPGQVNEPLNGRRVPPIGLGVGVKFSDDLKARRYGDWIHFSFEFIEHTYPLSPGGGNGNRPVPVVTPNWPQPITIMLYSTMGINGVVKSRLKSILKARLLHSTMTRGDLCH